MRIAYLFVAIFALLCWSSNASAYCTISQNSWNSYTIAFLNYGQSFTAACDGDLQSITVYTPNIANAGVPGVTIEIYNGLGGAIGTPIMTESFPASPDNDSVATEHIYLFSKKINLTAASTYSVIFNTAGVGWLPIGIDANRYPGGSFITNNTNIISNRDLMFSLAIVDSALRGDVDADDAVELNDAILALQVGAGMNPAGVRGNYANSGADVDGDNKIGHEEVIYILQTVAGLRGGAPHDTTPPTVNSTSPGSNATGIGVNAAINATFSETMDTLTITTSTFTLKQGATPVPGTVTYSGTTATFTPSSTLLYGTSYTATISTGVKDLAGNAMASNYTWSFTTAYVDGTGTWRGTYSTSLVPLTSITLYLTQSGSNLSGTYYSPNGATGTLSGTVSGNIVTFTLNQTTYGCAGTHTGSGTLSNKTLAFTFTGSDCFGYHANGQGTVTKD